MRQGAQRRVGGATFGAAAVVGQKTVGYGANRLANRMSKSNLVAKNYLGTGKLAMGAANKVADSSFDARRVGGLGKAAGLGDGKKGGFDTRIKEKNKSDEKFAESLHEVKTRDDNGDYINPKMKEDIEGAAEKSDSMKKAKADTTAASDKAVAAKAHLDATTKGGNASEEAKDQAAKQLADADKALADVKEAEKTTREAAKKSEEAKIIYGQQIQFMESLDRGRNLLSSISKGGVIGSTLVSASSAAGIGSVGGAAAAAVVGSQVTQNDESKKNLMKKYGADGTKMIKNKKRKEEAGLIAEALKEQGGDEVSSNDNSGNQAPTPPPAEPSNESTTV
jgi:hypothetical protein